MKAKSKTSKFVSLFLALSMTVFCLPTNIFAESSTNSTVYVYLTRHGETVSNVASRFVGGGGSTPLTENGRKIAGYLGVGLSNVSFKSVYSSPLSRTYETAELILAENQTVAHNLPIQQVEGLREVAIGKFENMIIADFAALAKLDMRTVSMKDMYNTIAAMDDTGKAETFDRLQARGIAALTSICEKEAKTGGGNILVVAHGSLNASIAKFFDESATGNPGNASIAILEYSDGKLSLKSNNDMSYVKNAQIRAANPIPVSMHLVVTAETNADKLGIINSVYDSSLTEQGIKDAKNIGNAIGANGFEAVYSSDLWKDLNTAKQVISGSSNPNLIVNTSVNMRGVSLGFFEAGLAKDSPKATSDNLTAKQIVEAYKVADKTNSVEGYNVAKERILSAYKTACQDAYEKGGGEIVIVAPLLSQQLVIDELIPTAKLSLLQSGSVVTIQYDGKSYYIADKIPPKIKIISYKLNGKVITTDIVPSTSKDGKIIAPLRTIAESLGAKVSWEQDSLTSVVTLESNVIRIPLNQAFPNDAGKAELINGRTYVPISYIGEKLGVKIELDTENGSVNINK